MRSDSRGWRRTRQIALAHNGNLPSADALVAFWRRRGITVKDASDSRLNGEAIACGRAGREALCNEAVAEVYPYMTGAFSLLVNVER